MPSVPYTFAPNTLIQSAQFNANFAVLLQCLGTSGGTLTGSLNSQTIVPVSANTYNLGSTSLPYASVVATLLKLMDTNASNTLAIAVGSNLTADRTLTVTTGDADRTLTISGDATISGSNTGDQLTFKTISVAGQSDIVADTATDTLTIAAGTGITITTNAGTDTLTITSSGGTIGGSTGANDNRLIRSDGTGGSTVQNSPIVVDDSGNITSGLADLKFGTSSTFSRTSKATDGTVFTAASDGFITLIIDATGSASGDAHVTSDSSNPPTTIVGACSAINGVNTTTSPIIKGQNYKITVNGTSGSPTFTAYWTPLGTAG